MIDEIVELCGRISSKLDAAIEAEYKFNAEMQIQFEQYSWEITRMSDGLKAVKERYC